MLEKTISKIMPDEFLGANRFDDKLMAEWHIISTSHPDHIGDVMSYEGMELPPSGKAIALLNHNEGWTGGLPLGKVLEYKIINGDDGVAQLWQHTQYLSNLPNDIGTKCYEARKLKAFTDSSIQFFSPEGGFEPVDPADMGKSQWEWSGTKYNKWKLFEAGPVLVGCNWNTGDMKAGRKSIMDMFTKALTPAPVGDAAGDSRLILTINQPILTVRG